MEDCKAVTRRLSVKRIIITSSPTKYKNKKPNQQISTMSRRGGGQKMIKQPIQVIFKSLQSKSKVSVALYESDTTMEGIIIGFDEYMNLVLDDATQLSSSGAVTSLGRILLKGENITWIANAA